MSDAGNTLLSKGPFTRRLAEAIVAAYQNVTIEDDPSTHFRLVLRDCEGQLLWRV
ncbi:DUF905 domain-containing protein [Salmonella enterica subsp. enterica serovar Poona]|nr:DUF905 domain-containing protein [Salmonella enterica subsp. enterica serovar Poona]HEB6949269.1 DUF905 family protein [Salmonella enterica subsp. enterica serovar Hvittingfoss]